jgi:transcription elongation factor Elf1
MAGKKKSKTDVAARREQREKGKKICPICGQEQKMAMMLDGRGKSEMVKLCCLRNEGIIK